MNEINQSSQPDGNTLCQSEREVTRSPIVTPNKSELVSRAGTSFEQRLISVIKVLWYEYPGWPLPDGSRFCVIRDSGNSGYGIAAGFFYEDLVRCLGEGQVLVSFSDEEHEKLKQSIEKEVARDDNSSSNNISSDESATLHPS